MDRTPGAASPARRRLSRQALFGLVAGFITSGLVSWATPDGNLVVTLVPSFVIGGAVYGLARWWLKARNRD